MNISSQNISLWEAPTNFFVHGNIDKEAVNRIISFPVFKVDSHNTKTVMNILKKFCPILDRFENLISIENDESKKGIILDPELYSKIEVVLTEMEKNKLKDINEELTTDKVFHLNIQLSYDNFKLATLMSWLLPKESIHSAFTAIGHIVHLNIKDDCVPYKYAIGALLIDKVRAAKCVVSKVNQIDNEFRTFELDLLAGEPFYITSMKEHGFEFSLDFSKVYWNSRLSTEHKRICDSLTPSDVVYDACAGIGPFAIPAAKKGCRVIANDLNDESVKWLKHNISSNSSKKKKIQIDVHNMDARDFIKEVAINDMVRHQIGSCEPIRYFLIMNLPSIAVNFLSALNECREIEKLSPGSVLHVRCYCFIGRECPRESIEAKIYEQLSDRVVNLNLRLVRNVAPNKDMFCAEITVRLSAAVVPQSTEEVVSKKQKMGES